MRAAYIGLGANLGDPAQQLRFAVERIGRIPGVRMRAISRFYRSPPMGPPDQPDYCNAVVVVETAVPARALLDALIEIERAAGRVRGAQKWGPRQLDLDLLLVDGEFIDEAGLHLPHPGIGQRNFVLQPLLDVAPDLEVPGLGKVRLLVDALGGAGLEPWFDPVKPSR